MRPFTLMELLIVVMILAILASLLLPALKTAIDYGKKMECTNNIRQIIYAMNYYAMDNNDQVIRLKAYCGMALPNYDSIKTPGVFVRHGKSDGKRFQEWTITPSSGFYYGVEWDLYLAVTYLNADGKLFYCKGRPMRWNFITAGSTNNWQLTASSYGLGYFGKSA